MFLDEIINGGDSKYTLEFRLQGTQINGGNEASC